LRVRLSLASKNSDLSEFEFHAVSSRLFEGGFAVAFTGLEDVDKRMLWECLLQESKAES